MKWILIFIYIHGTPATTLRAEFDDFKACDAQRAKLQEKFPKAYVDCAPKAYEQ